MTNAIRELKIRAEILQGLIKANDTRALARLRALPDYRRASNWHLTSVAKQIPRRQCLAVIAAELGFSSWAQAKGMITGEREAEEFGTLLCPRKCGGHINRWYKSYDEAASVRKVCRGYLLAYRRQCFVVDRYYIESLGLDPEDADWKAISFDWVRPRNVAARTRLYSKLVATLPRERTGQAGEVF
ncbi:MAG: hypothetical protein L0387_30835 [Acidobacteria bacterium]|nr:hypothetical protein [Acidobacteriota bacterium]